MITITEDLIKATYNECLEIAAMHYPMVEWSIQPDGMEFDSHKSKYGRATIEGKVLINPSFVGTNAINKLKETMFHELAHLIVGLENHHNWYFKSVFGRLAEGIKVNEAEKKEVINKNGYKYKLLCATAKNNYLVSVTFKRLKKYTEYDQAKRPLKIEGQRILEFFYIPYDAELPQGTIC